MRHLPNALSLFRLVCAPLVTLLLFAATAGEVGGSSVLALALTLFCVACLSDVADGLLARRMQTESLLGAILDPVADKVLMLCVAIGLIVLLPSWIIALPCLLMLARDLAVGGLREAALSRRWRLEVGVLGKFKTVLQCMAFGLVLLLVFLDLPLDLAWLSAPLWAATVLSLVSGLGYARSFAGKI